MKKKIKKIYDEIEYLVDRLAFEYDSAIYCEVSYYKKKKGWVTFICTDDGFKSLEDILDNDVDDYDKTHKSLW